MSEVLPVMSTNSPIYSNRFSIKRKLVGNTFWNMSIKLWKVLIHVVMLPIIVHYLGREAYGVYLLVSAIFGYSNLLDFGVGGALIKYISEYNVKGDKRSINKMITSTYIFYLLIGSFILLFGIVLTFFLENIFKLDNELLLIAQIILLLFAISSPLSWSTRTFSSVLQGLQRYDGKSLVS